MVRGSLQLAVMRGGHPNSADLPAATILARTSDQQTTESRAIDPGLSMGKPAGQSLVRNSALLGSWNDGIGQVPGPSAVDEGRPAGDRIGARCSRFDF